MLLVLTSHLPFPLSTPDTGVINIPSTRPHTTNQTGDYSHYQFIHVPPSLPREEQREELVYVCVFVCCVRQSLTGSGHVH